MDKSLPVKQATNETEAGETDTSLADMATLDIPTTMDISEKLRKAGVPLTMQRLAIAQVLLAKPAHMTPDQILTEVQKNMAEISRATVYNTLNLFKEKGLVRELIVGPGQAVYDSNTSPHFHIYNVVTGEMSDIPAGDLKVVGKTALLAGVKLEEVDVIIRVNNK